MRIAIPKEVMPGEGRVAAIPETVAEMIGMGHEVMIERGAGVPSHHPDAEYTGAGARIVESAGGLYAAADVVLKVKEPQMNEREGNHETEMLREGSDLIAFLHPASPSNLDMVRRLAERRIRSFTLDSIPRIPEARKMDALASMSTVAGYKSVIMAVDAIPRFACGISTPVGDLPAAKTLVVGVGAVGTEAIATALRLGMSVTAFDVHPKGAERARELGASAVDFSVPVDLLTDENGHPRPLTEEWVGKVRQALAAPVADSDIVILSAIVRGETAPVLVTGDMVRSMRSGSVVVDVSIDQGGNCEATKPGEITEFEGVTMMGIKNIPGRLRHHSTVLFSRNVLHFFAHLAKGGTIAPDPDDEIARSTLVTRDGKIVHEGTLHALARCDRAYRTGPQS